MKKYLIAFLPFLISTQQLTHAQDINVNHYDLTLEPNIEKQSLKGILAIDLTKPIGVDKFEISIGSLQIDSLYHPEVIDYKIEGGSLVLQCDPKADTLFQVKLKYQGKPRRGIVFEPKYNQVTTVFHTAGWMPCNPDPSDRATFNLNLVIPDTLSSIACGELNGIKQLSNNRNLYSWEQSVPIPAYTFGFSIGSYQSASQNHAGVTFNYFSPNHTKDQLEQIFGNTPDMLKFLEDKTGVRYGHLTYSQLLNYGGISQEMGEFAVMRNSYGNQVLKDSTQINLGVHELAHQWWGNMITCKNWNHFWLNEGFAVFMSSAFKEQLFGTEVYLADIKVYKDAYTKVLDKGLDKPLEFENWDSPTREDRTLVYYKGAYFLHVLRQKLGDQKFWKGIKAYSSSYFGQSVESKDFQMAMEKATDTNLQQLFDEWVYLK